MTLLQEKFDLLEEKSEVLKTMGHPLRLCIIDILRGGKQLTVTEIYSALEIEQAVASHHLRIMKNSGILKSSKSGKNVFYELKEGHIEEIFSLLIS